ncbi:MAG: DEAD/DEAH box helicase [Promethearchaeota archaeon]
MFDISREQFLKIKKRLKKTWLNFFGKFGKLLESQILTIPLILDGENVLLSASTASGKTEAIVAPVVESIFSENLKGLSVIYISPTRALVNDLETRLKDKLEELNISLSIKTGDRPQFNPKKPSQFLITTPESLDSLICRHPYTFKNLRVVILDEIHLIDRTYRGDQLRILLLRLQELTNNKFNVHILSATIADPNELGKRYTKDFKIVRLQHKRQINYTLIANLDEIVNFIKKEVLKKILIFCNSRKKVEELSISWRNLNLPMEVLTHHGSLSKQYRERTEKFFKRYQYIACIATTSLEIGIDIGNIDAVVLADIPWSVSTLLQRIGRGNRRELVNRVFALYEGKGYKKNIFEEMFNLAIKGELEVKKYFPDLSVIVQQVFSCLFAHREGLQEQYFSKLFQDFCTTKELQDILEHLRDLNFIEFRREKWYATEKLMDIGEKGLIHTNIPDETSLPVIDVVTNSKIGNVLFPIDNIFILGGRIWKIVKILPKKILVRQEKLKAYSPEFEIKMKIGRYFFYLPEYIREMIKRNLSNS